MHFHSSFMHLQKLSAGFNVNYNSEKNSLIRLIDVHVHYAMLLTPFLAG